MVVFITGPDFHLPFVTVVLGKTRFTGRGAVDGYGYPISYDLPVEGRAPAAFLRALKPANNDNEASCL